MPGEIIAFGVKLDPAQLKRGVDAANKKLDDLTNRAKRVDKALKLAAAAGAAFLVLKTAVGVATRAFDKLVTAAKAGEQSQAKLEAVIKATGGAAQRTVKQVNALSDALARSTLFDDDQIRDAAAVMATFRNVQGETYDEAIRLSLDLASVLGGDLQAAAIQLGKALNDPILGITALSRSGITFSDEQKRLIRTLTETGRAAEAQRIILRELEMQFGGTAEAQNVGVTGATATARKEWDNFLESLARSEEVSGAIIGLAGLSTRLAIFAQRVVEVNSAFAKSDFARMINRAMFRRIGREPPREEAEPSFQPISALLEAIEQPRAPEPTETTARTKQLEAIDKTIEALQLEAQTFGMGREELVLYKLALEDATEAQLQTAEAALELISQQEQTQAIQATIDALARESEILGLTSGELAIYDLALLGATDAQLEAATASVELVTEFEKQQEAMREIEAEAERMAQVWDNAISDMQASFKDLLHTLFSGGDFGDFLGRLGRRLESAAIDSLFKSFGLAEAGGIVGQTPMPTRSVSPAVFVGAPSFQRGGLVGDEVPIIAHRGELIVPKGQVAAMGAEPAPIINQEINFNISALDAASVDTMLRQRKFTIAQALAEAVEEAPALRRMLRGRR